MERIYAHTLPGAPEEDWQPLSEHLEAVSTFAANKAEAFSAGNLAKAAGILHDLGKTSGSFQDRLKNEALRADHKKLGASCALYKYRAPWAKMLAYVVLGHHGGLPDEVNDVDATAFRSAAPSQVSPYVNNLPDSIIPRPTVPPKNYAEGAPYFQLLIRMIFSCLVDGDYLDTEGFCDPEKAARRPKALPLASLFPAYEAQKAAYLVGEAQGNVNRARRAILEDCIRMGVAPKGLYKLTAPTGSGKTFASLAFATEQAKAHKMDRIIYALPFITVTQQTAAVFREILGDDAVLEHHSNLDFETKGAEIEDHIRLLSQNWDAPLIVTTTVQLLESLFAAKPSKARKIHSLTNAVIIFDEAQALPDAFLRPTLAMLKALAENFGSTIVFSTATQPALNKGFHAIDPMEIIREPERHFTALERVSTENAGILSDEDIADRLVNENQALIVVNTRKHAKALYDRLKTMGDGIYHLSALMCPAHRDKLIHPQTKGDAQMGEILRRLKAKERCIVVSTNLIEAGVDLDFPVVFREYAGLESLAQSAGRCNREGKLLDENGAPKLGRFVFFQSAEYAPPQYLKENIGFAAEVLDDIEGNPFAPAAIERYFELRYGKGAVLDREKILETWETGCLAIDFRFAHVAKVYRLIDDIGATIIIPYDEKARELLRNPLANLRKLQRYSVTVYDLEPIHRFLLPIQGHNGQALEDIYVLNDSPQSQYEACYNEETGLALSPKDVPLHI
ncbi:MAG: CRISPR-associated helicase Cas3' [Oscillospiraceae bacterium]|jgi:CRISPR-associated helicase Cas3/CRISPR-associated endonuclease Cas3-HD|nr:CRISPR-associated helicase Cas3' [Oscillospiraceae bacterium]